MHNNGMHRQRLFSLLSGRPLLLAPGTKIVPGHEFEILQEAGEVLETIQQEAASYREEVAKEGEQAKEAGWHAGFEEGFEAWSQHLAQLETTFAELKANIEKQIFPIALQAAKKIVGQALQLSEDTIVTIIASSLKPVTQHKRITIYVNPQEWPLVDQAKPQLRTLFEHVESLSIRPREGISPGGCVIETELGIINAQIEQRWAILERAFEKMATQPHPAPSNSSSQESKKKKEQERTKGEEHEGEE
jgi:type III secretion protein L